VSPSPPTRSQQIAVRLAAVAPALALGAAAAPSVVLLAKERTVIAKAPSPTQSANVVDSSSPFLNSTRGRLSAYRRIKSQLLPTTSALHLSLSPTSHATHSSSVCSLLTSTEPSENV